MPKVLMAKKLPAEQEELVQAVINLAIENSAVRKGIVTDPAATIDRFSRILGFDSQKLSLEALDVIASVTLEEFELMVHLSKKAKNNDIQSVKFVL
ncbi:MAG: hypothetical protein ACHQ1H_08265 [Nitrososphaerales archaeon]